MRTQCAALLQDELVTSAVTQVMIGDIVCYRRSAVLRALARVALVISSASSRIGAEPRSPPRCRARTQTICGKVDGAIERLRVNAASRCAAIGQLGSVLLSATICAIVLAAAVASSAARRAPLGRLSASACLRSLLTHAHRLIFGEVLPKTYAIAIPTSTRSFIAAAGAFLIWCSRRSCRRVQFIVGGTLRLFGVTRDAAPRSYAAAAEIRGAVELHAEEGARRARRSATACAARSISAN